MIEMSRRFRFRTIDGFLRAPWNAVNTCPRNYCCDDTHCAAIFPLLIPKSERTTRTCSSGSLDVKWVGREQLTSLQSSMRPLFTAERSSESSSSEESPELASPFFNAGAVAAGWLDELESDRVTGRVEPTPAQ